MALSLLVAKPFLNEELSAKRLPSILLLACLAPEWPPAGKFIKIKAWAEQNTFL
jgi:hypothetical protein